MVAKPLLAEVWPDEAQLWQWSLALYPLIKTQCLYWQDEYQANVNLLLLLLYLQRQQQQLNALQLQQLCDALQPQQAFTREIRQLRRQLPPHLTTAEEKQLKQALLQTELVAEQVEQRLLVQALPRVQACPDGDATTALLPLYLTQLAMVPSSTLQQQLLDLDQAARQVATPSR